ncbi:hypothetical protein BDV96DRAFT_644669 [Lophiotrema nucula]|uniref:Mid2 domain-containing protein n=1 Tax=Lophiotrema nucula TaxID=690887 RepID=A0A6A5ZE74_9PLEO|nr:hypothetical protein BDV96DRAFT_644669 [Lophiotrema nucula]
MASHHPCILALLLPPLLPSAHTAQITAGPLAPASIYTLIEYSTARPCAADRLWDNGGIPCGAGRFYNDLVLALGYGCGAINACYCSTGLCDGVGAVGPDVSSMLGLYGGYCATANVGFSTSAPTSRDATKTTSAEELAETTGEVFGTKASATASSASRTSTPTSTSTATSTPEAKEDEGLSKSDIIALATGLGVGIPSLIIAVVALVIQLRKRSGRNTLDSGPSSPMESQIHVLRTLTSLQAQTPPRTNVPLPYQHPHQSSFQNLAPAGSQVHQLAGQVGGSWE